MLRLVMQYGEGGGYDVCLLMESSQAAHPYLHPIPNAGSPDHSMLILTWFNSDESLSFHWPGWACFIYALKPLLSPTL